MPNIFSRLFKTPRISLAIIGVPASGKSYLISDIIESFRSMGLQYYDLQRDGIAYRGFGSYDTDVMGAEGMRGTPDYACRANNHYGARMKGGERTFEIDFLNIPGETFAANQKKINIFFQVRKALKTKAASRFRLITWKRDNDVEYIVEPIGVSQYVSDYIASSRSSFISENTEARILDYMDWPQIFAEINENGRHLTPAAQKIISGEQLLDHITEYNVDSVMRSIAEVLPTILPEIDKTDFITKYSKAFYFLNFCSRATDIIICDKMILPSGENPKRKKPDSEDEELGFNSFLHSLESFFADEAKAYNFRPNVFMAYRGTDFLIKTKERTWRNFANCPPIATMLPSERRNVIYALISALIYHHYNALYRPTAVEFNQHIGLPDDYDWGTTDADVTDVLTERFMDFSPEGGTVMTQGSLLDLFRSHQGGPLDHLMVRSYGKHDPDGSPLDRIKRHIYYTATPVSEDIIVFSNDAESHNTRFVRNDIIGDTRYFDNYGSHLCLGTFQLCLDLLFQHDLADNGDFGDIYYYLQQR